MIAGLSFNAHKLVSFSHAERKPEVLLGGRCGTELKCSTAGPCRNGSLGSSKNSLRVNPVCPSSAHMFILSFVRIEVSNFRFSNGNKF